MTDRLDEIQARVEAATPGPWEVTQEGWSVISAACNICGTYHNHSMHDGGRTWDAQPDADFIAHSREDVPFLLAEVSKLRAIIEEAATRAASGIEDCKVRMTAHNPNGGFLASEPNVTLYEYWHGKKSAYQAIEFILAKATPEGGTK